MSASRPRPPLSEDALAQDVFWHHAQQRELVYQRCQACRSIVFYPRGHCTSCGSDDLVVKHSAGRGTIYSLTVTHVHPDPFFAARTPFAVGFIDLDEGFRMLAEVLGDPASLAIGDRVYVEWQDSEGFAIPLFAADAG